MKSFSTTVCFLLSIALAGCASDTNLSYASNSTPTPKNSMAANTANSVADANNNEPAPPTGMTDSDFVKAMAISGVSQVELGKIASTKALDPEIKAFAQTMVTENSKRNEELKALASKMQVTLLTAVTKGQKSFIDGFRNRAGAAFDKAYVRVMMETHEAIVADFESKAKDAADPDLKSFAETTLPTLRKHLEEITAIQARMK